MEMIIVIGEKREEDGQQRKQEERREGRLICNHIVRLIRPSLAGAQIDHASRSVKQKPRRVPIFRRGRVAKIGAREPFHRGDGGGAGELFARFVA